MKTRLAALAIVLAVIASMAGCSVTPAATATQAPETVQTATEAPATESPTAAPTATPKLDITPEPGPLTLRYVAWNVGTKEENNMERQMVQAYMDAHPGTTIEIVENVDFDEAYMESLATLAASGDLPDVLMVSVVPDFLANNYLMDIKDIAPNDDEWVNIPANVEAATHFGSGIYTVPSALFSYGFFVNDDIFDAANVPRIQNGFSWDEMYNAIKKTTDPSKDILGINEVGAMVDWYPHYVNDKLGHSTWDGTKFNLDAPEFSQAVAIAKELQKGKYTYSSLSEQELAKYNTDWYGGVWEQGKMAVTFDCTWSLPDYFDDTFHSRFVGMPGNKNIAIPDFVGISSNCKTPKAAFDFIKFMTYGKEGIMKRIGIRDTQKVVFESLPLSKDSEVVAAYFANTYPGLKEAYATMDEAIIEGETVIPGYVNALYDALTGISVKNAAGETIDNARVRDLINACIDTDLNINDYIPQLNQIANNEEAKVAAEIADYVK